MTGILSMPWGTAIVMGVEGRPPKRYYIPVYQPMSVWSPHETPDQHDGAYRLVFGLVEVIGDAARYEFLEISRF